MVALLASLPLIITLSLVSLPPVIYFYWLEQIDVIETPNVAKDGYWGAGEPSKDDEAVKVFKINVDKQKLSDLHFRLSSSGLSLDGNSLGDDRLSMIYNLTQVMLKFDWPQHQHFLNTFKQYTTEVEGLSVHFVRASLPVPKGTRLVPIVLLHGNYGSYWDYFKVIPILSNPKRFGFDFGVKENIQFDVIVPSLPGFVWSENPTKQGMDDADMARILHKLMTRLTDEPYFIHGSEGLGGELAALMGCFYGSAIRGVHVSNPWVDPMFSTKVATKFLLENIRNPSEILNQIIDSQWDRTKDVLAYSTLDSPLCVSALLVDEWSSSSRLSFSAPSSFLSLSRSVSSSGLSPVTSSLQLNRLFTLDEVATIVHLYWLTDTTKHAINVEKTSKMTKYSCVVSIPTGIVQSGDAPFKVTSSILRHRFSNISRLSRTERGGAMDHLEEPEGVAREIFTFVEMTLI